MTHSEFVAQVNDDIRALMRQAETEQAQRTAELWERVEFTYAEGLRCRGCYYKHSWREATGERLRECDLLNAKATREPEECPGVSDDI